MHIIHIDLQSGKTRAQEIREDIERKWIGGKGLAGYLLRPDVTRGWDDPQMPLIFMSGPLVGTPSPTSGRICVMSRSPLTGTIADCSVGGRFGTQLRRAGIDGLVILMVSSSYLSCGARWRRNRYIILDVSASNCDLAGSLLVCQH